MSEQIDIEKPEKHFEGRYKYLADFAMNEHSPHLRKHYNDSLSRRSNSHDRKSNSNSRDRISPYKHSPYNHNPNPSPTTFNPSRSLHPRTSTFHPRRQPTQQQFSPYDQGIINQDQHLNKALLEENSLLHTSLNQANKTIQSLRSQLLLKNQQITSIRTTTQSDLRYFQKLVEEMTNQIQIVLTKNKILENQLIMVKGRLQDQLRRGEDVKRMEEERKRFQDFRRREDIRRVEDVKRVEERRNNSQMGGTRRSVGKLLMRPVSNTQQESLGTSKIKIEEQIETVNQIGVDSNAEAKKVQSENRKAQELIGSIRSMQGKICGQSSDSLKELWKWLKGMGHSHSCLKRWKAKAEASSFSSVDRLKELIRQACGYIQ